MTTWSTRTADSVLPKTCLKRRHIQCSSLHALLLIGQPSWCLQAHPNVLKPCWQRLPVTWLTPMLLPLCSWVTLMLSAYTSNWKMQQCCRGARESAHGFSSKQGQQLQKPLLNRISLLQLADTMAAVMLQPRLDPGGRNTPALCRACKQPRVGHPKSGCPTNCMKCKNLHDVCACPGKLHPRDSLLA